MVTYILLMKLTDKGIVDVKDSPKRVVDAMKLWESMGGKTIAVYMTMGDFDFVAIGEGPDDRAAAAFGLALGATGTVRTSSLKAFGLEEAKQIVAALPRAAAVVA
jgi:uncharacterized protein with GYD domain